MSRKFRKRWLASASLAAALGMSASPAKAESQETAAKPKESSKLNLAGLAAVLQAASDRKQTGPEVTLKKDAYLHSRPTGPETRSNVLHAGTVLRKSKNQIVNANGSWRHVETREGMDGWVNEFDLDPDP